MKLVSLKAANGEERQISDLGIAPPGVRFSARTGLGGFSLAPDGRSYASSIARPKGDLWILEGFRKP